MAVLDLAKYTKELSNHLNEADNILIVCHVNPDGDAIGSLLALYHYLTTCGKKAEMISPNYLQDFIKWMDGVEKINIYIKDRAHCKSIIEKSNLVIMVDFNQTGRLGEAEDAVVKSTAKKIIIDHHLNSADFSDLLISDPSKCSTSELLHLLITGINNGPFLNKPYAEAIYVGIVTDTGNFDHGSYNGTTFRTVADLLDAGIEKERIFNLVFNNFSADRMRLQGLALNERMVVMPELGAAYIYLSKEDLKKYNYRKGDTEGFVNMPLSISGINFSAFFVEKEGFIKLSFRSKGKFSVSEFAEKYFKGGGHRNASGGDHYDTLENTLAYFMKILKDEAEKINNSLL
jgi:bifunctional oligoribonuclease and PAP phosphatase NrnA